MLCSCPKPTALTAIPSFTCGEKFDQIVKMAIQRIQSTASFNGTDKLITALSTWTPLLTASDNTKVIVTPFFAELVIPPSENAEEGGNDNSTVNGIPINLGEQPVKPTGIFRNLPYNVKDALAKIACESVGSYGTAQIWAYFFNKDGKIISQGNNGIPLYNWRVSTPGSEGFNQDNKFHFSFWLANNWDTNLAIATPAFNPLTDL